MMPFFEYKKTRARLTEAETENKTLRAEVEALRSDLLWHVAELRRLKTVLELDKDDESIQDEG